LQERKGITSFKVEASGYGDKEMGSHAKGANTEAKKGTETKKFGDHAKGVGAKTQQANK